MAKKPVAGKKTEAPAPSRATRSRPRPSTDDSDISPVLPQVKWVNDERFLLIFNQFLFFLDEAGSMSVENVRNLRIHLLHIWLPTTIKFPTAF